MKVGQDSLATCSQLQVDDKIYDIQETTNIETKGAYS